MALEIRDGVAARMTIELSPVLSGAFIVWVLVGYGKLYGENWGWASIPEIFEARLRFLITGEKHHLLK